MSVAILLGGHPADHGRSLRDVLGAAWAWDAVLALGLVVLAAAHARGVLTVWRIAGRGRGVSTGQAAAYLGGLGVLAVALLSALDRASDVLFSAHMAQHELLMLVAAPLVVIGRPLPAFLWALPRRLRRRATAAVQHRRVVSAWGLATAPLVALVVHGVVRWAWHAPVAFDAALADERIHAVQHLTFFGSATLFWWAIVHGRYRRAGYGLAVAFVFVTAIHSGLLAALLSLSSSPWYAAHAERTAASGLDALGDQQRAGLLMWVPAAVLMTGIGLALLAAWLGEAKRRIARSAHAGLRGGERR